MPSANAPRETSNPTPPGAQTTELGASCADPAAALAALAKLIVLALYLQIMALLGFKLRRIRRPSPASRAAAHPRTRASRRPRRTHKYIDRDACLAMLAEANQACTAARPTQPTAPAASIAHPPRRPAAPHPRPVASTILPRRHHAPPTHTRPSLQKPAPSPHAYARP
jgi:hypothetical protein